MSPSPEEFIPEETKMCSSSSEKENKLDLSAAWQIQDHEKLLEKMLS